MPTIFSKETLGKDRVIGFYDTPLPTVAYICSKILPHYKPGMKVLDPAVGVGVFLEYLLSQGDIYYQAYMPFTTQEQFERAYGKERVAKMRELKQKYDPENLFSNAHTKKYYDQKEVQ